MSEIMAYVNALLDIALSLGMLVVMGFMFYLLSLALVAMARNKQPRWDAIAYVVAILVLGLAMWRFFPTIGIRTVRVSLQDARPEVILLQEEIREWIPSFDVALPTPAPTPTVFDPLLPAVVTNTPLPEFVPTPVVSVTVGTVSAPTAIVPPATATPYPTYTPWPTPTPLPTATQCLVQLESGDWLACPPTPVLGGG